MAVHKLPRVIRLDDSDVNVYENAARPGECAVPGGFTFQHDSIENLAGKKLQAFVRGFLGIETLGHTTLVAVAELGPDEYQNAVNQLSMQMLHHFGAPDRSVALKAALEEIRYAESLCEYQKGTILALERKFSEDEITESFKKFVPSGSVDWEQGKPLVYLLDEEDPAQED